MCGSNHGERQGLTRLYGYNKMHGKQDAYEESTIEIINNLGEDCISDTKSKFKGDRWQGRMYLTAKNK